MYCSVVLCTIYYSNIHTCSGKLLVQASITHCDSTKIQRYDASTVIADTETE